MNSLREQRRSDRHHRGGARDLLDEPTPDEQERDRRFIELPRVHGRQDADTVEQTWACIRPADKIAVLVYGEVIAFDVPEAVRANVRVQEAYLGSVAEHA